MNKKLLIFLSSLSVLGLVFLGFSKLGNPLPAVLPQKRQPVSLPKPQPKITTNSIPSDQAEQLGLNLVNNLGISIYANNTPGVRDLEFSPKETLLASLTGEGQVLALSNKNGQVNKKVVLKDLDRPHGLSFWDGRLFVAQETKLTSYAWSEDSLQVSDSQDILNFPKGGRHTTRSLDFDSQGNLYISLGSTCNVCFEDHPWLTTVIKTDSQGNDPQVFAKGLRNAVFLKVQPQTDQVWVTEMGRDFLGDNTPPDEINILKQKANYGYPICYGNQVYDREFGARSSEYCQQTTSPAYNIQAHSAPLGLTFVNSPQMPQEWQGDLLVAYHGSWNRTVPVGYKVVRLKIEGDQTTSENDLITGFLKGQQASGRPVDLTFDQNGNLYLSDDKAGRVYIIFKKTS